MKTLRNLLALLDGLARQYEFGKRPVNDLIEGDPTRLTVEEMERLIPLLGSMTQFAASAPQPEPAAPVAYTDDDVVALGGKQYRYGDIPKDDRGYVSVYWLDKNCTCAKQRHGTDEDYAHDVANAPAASREPNGGYI